VAPLLVADRLHRTYFSGPTRVDAVSDVSLEVSRGELVAIVGPSGCGKSTLLHLCAAMDRPSSGRVTLEGVALDGMSDDAGRALSRAWKNKTADQFFVKVQYRFD